MHVSSLGCEEMNWTKYRLILAAACFLYNLVKKKLLMWTFSPPPPRFFLCLILRWMWPPSRHWRWHISSPHKSKHISYAPIHQPHVSKCQQQFFTATTRLLLELLCFFFFFFIFLTLTSLEIQWLIDTKKKYSIVHIYTPNCVRDREESKSVTTTKWLEGLEFHWKVNSKLSPRRDLDLDSVFGVEITVSSRSVIFSGGEWRSTDISR